MYCKHCGMESDNDRVCSWCRKPLAAQPTPAGQPPPGPPPPGLPAAGVPPPPAAPPAAPPPAEGGGMARLGEEPASDLLAEPSPVPTPWQAPPPPPAGVAATPAGPDDLPPVPDLAAPTVGGPASPGLEVSGPTAARRFPVAVLIALPIFLVLAVAAVLMGRGSYTPMKPVTDWKPYTDNYKFFSVDMPARWRVQATGGGNRNVLWVFAESNLIEATFRQDDYFYLRTDALKGKASMLGVSPVKLAHQMRVASLRKHLPGLATTGEGECQVDGATAYYSEFRASRKSLLKSVPIRGLAFTWMVGDVGYSADFTCPARDFDTFKPIVERMMASLNLNL